MVDAKCRESIASFGAVSDGIADDTTAIQTAIETNDGGLLFFPTGIYKMFGSKVQIYGMYVQKDKFGVMPPFSMKHKSIIDHSLGAKDKRNGR